MTQSSCCRFACTCTELPVELLLFTFSQLVSTHEATVNIRLFFRPSVRPSVSPFVPLSVHLFALSSVRVRPSVSLSVTLFICSPFHLSVSVRPSVRPCVSSSSVRPFVRQTDRSSVRPTVRPFVRPSVPFPSVRAVMERPSCRRIKNQTLERVCLVNVI